MTAAAGAFALIFLLMGEPETWWQGGLALLIAMVGGAIEGLAVGYAQWLLLKRWLLSLTALAWVGVTVAAAVVGWFLGTLPSIVLGIVADDSAAPEAATAGPPLWVMPLIGMGSGLVLGALFGWAQSLVLRRHVTNARTWTMANALGWAAAMAVMFTGAGIPSEPWPLGRLLPLAALTGVVAGLAIGGVTGAFLQRLRPTPVTE